MARASTTTLLSLDRFAAVLGIHPLHFNQVQVNLENGSIGCGNIITQYNWQQSAATSREEIAYAIELAEAEISRWLGYKCLPTWEAAEISDYTRPRVAEVYPALPLNVRDMWQSLKTNYGYVLSGGVEAKTAIEAAAAIVYSDADSDSYKETATITVPTTVTEPDEIAIYYPSKNAAGDWEIRPITVNIVGGNAIITCRREQLVKEEYMEGLSVRAVDGLNDTYFLTTVDVYRHWTDPQQQITFMWENYPNTCGCLSESCASCTGAVQSGCLTVRDARRGLVAGSPALWDADSDSFVGGVFSMFRGPDRGKLWYQAGWQDTRMKYPRVQMDRGWESIIAHLAVTYLERSICSCQNVTSIINRWREDLTLRVSTPASASSFAVGKRVMDNPLGTTRAAVEAWQRISRDRIGEGT